MIVTALTVYLIKKYYSKSSSTPTKDIQKTDLNTNSSSTSASERSIAVAMASKFATEQKPLNTSQSINTQTRKMKDFIKKKNL